jgi:hypothetical protein
MALVSGSVIRDRWAFHRRYPVSLDAGGMKAYVHVDSGEVAESVQRPTMICAMSVSFGPRSASIIDPSL